MVLFCPVSKGGFNDLISYILLLIGVFLFSKLFHNMWNMFGLQFKDDAERTERTHARALKVFWFSLIILLGLVYLGWLLKGNMFLLWFGIIFVIEFIVERREFNWRYFGIKGESDHIVKLFLNLARIAYIVAFFLWYIN